ncbi:MAG: magnesium/cobalt transporter CorA [Deltaproteobacteria bacterium]|nr:magnesium/cobalt transporter CorA [Deltaproteobacteria bacterium]MBI3388849.1 magnesium/cobalt transporter CorA [Deltaproteobacteria bacterium]
MDPGTIVNCAAYADGRRLANVAIGDIPTVLESDAQFIWVGLYEPDEPLLRQVQQVFGLHDLAVEDALRAHQRPKLEEYGDGLFVVLRTAQLHERQIDFGETHIFVGPRWIVSVRHGASDSYADVRARCESTPNLLRKGTGFVLYALTDFVVDHYFPIVDALEEELERLEEEIFGGSFTRATTERIYELKRDLVSLKRAVSPLLEVCNRLVRFDMMLIPDDVRLYFRDVYDHVVRTNETVDNLRELLTTALEANLSLISVRQNEVMKKLGAWAAILAVPTMIAGIYGMNFEFMPELHWQYGYGLAVGVMAAACGWLYVSFKRSGWL